MTITSTSITPQVDGSVPPSHTPLLAVRNLSVRFPKRYGDVAVLDNINLAVNPGEAVAIVGESGCGKSLLGLAAANLLPSSAEWTGSVEFRGVNVRAMSRRDRRRMHGSRVGVVYQDAMNSLNPGMTIGAQLRQVCRLGSTSTPEDLLLSVGLDDTNRVMHSRPYQLSGGQRQRVLIAMALARDPDVIIADEPTTALDVTVQRHVIDLLQRLQATRAFALIFISHDLALVSRVTTRTTVLYAGQVVEAGPTRQLLDQPCHPYTAGLVRASLSLEQRRQTLSPIPGYVRQPSAFPSGCRFRDRCQHADDACSSVPVLNSTSSRQLACFHPVAANNSLSIPAATNPDSRPTDMGLLNHLGGDE